MAKKISEDVCRRIVSLFEMTQRAAQEGVDEHTKNEGINATAALLRLLAKHGLGLVDLPDIQRQHAEYEAAKKGTASAATPSNNQPNVPELIQHVLWEYVDLEPHEYIGAVLWILHTHVFNHFQVTPRLALLSPVRGCGKTNFLKVIERLTPNPERYDNITAATLFRLIDGGSPTLLLDEGDNLGLRIDRNLRNVLNGGYERGGKIGRSPGGVERDYSTFAPLAIAAIGMLPLPLMSRSIHFPMHRSRRDDLKTKEMLDTPAEKNRLEALRRLIVAWAQSVTAFNKQPQLPGLLRGRMADNWRVLVSVADSFGNSYWSKAAREAAVVFAAGYHDEDAPVALLTDIRIIFIRLRVDRIKSLDLAHELHQLEDGMGVWSAWCGEHDDQAPHPISQGEIAILLRRFSRTELRPKPLYDRGSRTSRGSAGRGYYHKQFEPWWERYCDKQSDAEIRQLCTEEKEKP